MKNTLPTPIRLMIQTLRRAGRTRAEPASARGVRCGASRLEIENQRHRIKELETKVQADAYREMETP